MKKLYLTTIAFILLLSSFSLTAGDPSVSALASQYTAATIKVHGETGSVLTESSALLSGCIQ